MGMFDWLGQNVWPWEQPPDEGAKGTRGGVWSPFANIDPRSRQKTGAMVPQTYEELMGRNLPYRTKKIQVETMFPERYEEFINRHGSPADKIAFRKDVEKEVEKAKGLDVESLRAEAAEEKAYEREQARLARLDRLAAQRYKEEQSKLDREFRTAQAEEEKYRQMTPAEKMVFDFEKKKEAKRQERLEAERATEQEKWERRFEEEQLWRKEQRAQQQEQLDWSKEQFRLQQEAEKKSRLAALAAQPASWLRYAAEADEAPVIQPWMQPLMAQDYKGLGTGEEIPGWSATDMSDMPGLLTPSAQLQARMGPTAMRQLYAYKQARTGQTPEESQFRMWSGAPPSGRFGGYSRGRMQA